MTRADADGIEVELTTPRCEGCEGLCVWRRLPRAERVTFANRQTVGVGERVVVALPDRYLLLASLLVHGLPLLGLLGGALCGAATLGSDLAAAAGAAGGAALAVLAAPALRARFERGTLTRVQLRPASDRAQTHSL